MKTYQKLWVSLALFYFGLMTAQADDGGKCGDNVTWKYRSSDSTLILSGTGTTYDGDSPWSGIIYWSDPTLLPTRWSDSIYHVIVGEGITSIGNNLFEGLNRVEKISLPESLTFIGSGAFNLCSSMTDLNIPSSVKKIGSYAFNKCRSLKTIVLPSILKTIEQGTFSYCGLTEISIPSSVGRIDAVAFWGCSNLSQITVDENNAKYDSRESCNALIETSSNTLLVGCINTIFPASVKAIGDAAFCYQKITSMIIPSSVSSIGEDAFRECPYLRTVTIPESVKSIKLNAFFKCPKLEIVRTDWTTPLAVPSIFDQSPKKILVVPEGCVEVYKNADIWKDFEQIVTATDIKGEALINDDSIKEIYRLDGTKVSGEQESLVPGTYIVQGGKILIK
ncbi:MAG: leucine-rich repeat domain-containing protein [Bacteroidales bacterium]|nr:leucine-rich repeat domain-containing protein [Bacteroidales bacterium]